MSRVIPLADHLAPDTIMKLECAAKMRFDDAQKLNSQGHLLAAVYLFGYSVEMYLTAAYFRSSGFSSNSPIDRDIRRRRMAQARQITVTSGQQLMNADPHPLVGWARFLEWQRLARGNLAPNESRRLKEAIVNAELVYKHWRPELRYKVTNVSPNQLAEVRTAATWFVECCGRL
ncbi:MAG TPA: hypothetical protein VGY55_12825 [Pirellulales bacterium]|jgi:hypothetical protein|nr:hypothetical protein [Pirellulales bacterium]